MDKLVKNAIQCKLCGDIIESAYTHNYVKCSCGNCSVDGGLDYQRISCNDLNTIVNLAVYEKEDQDNL